MRTIGPFVNERGPWERDGRGRGRRRWRRAEATEGYSLWWSVEGRGRKGVTLNLRRPKGQELFRRLVEHADVVCENFRPGTLEAWNIGPDDCDPRLVWARISVFGQDGPNAGRPGLDRMGIAYGGLLNLTGYPDRPPVRPGRHHLGLPDGRVRGGGSDRRPVSPGSSGDGHGTWGRGRRPALRLHLAHSGVDDRRAGSHRPHPPTGRQPTPQLRAARQLPHRRRSLRLHRGRIRRQLLQAVRGHGSGGSDATTRGGPRSPSGPPMPTRSTTSSPDGPGQRTAEEIEAQCIEHGVPVGTIYDANDIMADPHMRGPGRPGHGRRPGGRTAAAAGSLSPPRREGAGGAGSRSPPRTTQPRGVVRTGRVERRRARRGRRRGHHLSPPCSTRP